MVTDVIITTNKNLKKNKIKLIDDIYLQKQEIVSFSDKVKKIDREVKDFLLENMYNNKKVLINTNRGKKIIKDLFNCLLKNPKKYITNELFKEDSKERVVADFIAGMTDRYAINLHNNIK